VIGLALTIFFARFWIANLGTWPLVISGLFLVNLAIRSLRWQYLLAPLGHTSFMNSFRATAVGFAASSVLPARAGEVIRPYFLARQAPADQKGRMTATGAFATIILERLLDTVTVLVLLASLVFVFGKDLAGVNPAGFALVKWAGASAAAVSVSALVVLFFLAGDPARLGRTMARLEQVLPSALAGMIAKIAEKFARGLGAIRDPGRLLIALAWSFPLWLSICLGIWSVAMAFRFAIPFTGSFLLLALLVLGVAVPTPARSAAFTRRSVSARRCSTGRPRTPRSAPPSCCTSSRFFPHSSWASFSRHRRA
jgi:uncharacterized protein (TIRG00374 family)